RPPRLWSGVLWSGLNPDYRAGRIHHRAFRGFAAAPLVLAELAAGGDVVAPASPLAHRPAAGPGGAEAPVGLAGGEVVLPAQARTIRAPSDGNVASLAPRTR